jgi:hypothetical protein
MNTRTRDKYQQLVSTVKSPPAAPTAVAHPCDEGSPSGAIGAAKMNIIVPILPGPRHKIFAAAQAANLDAAHTRLSTRSTATMQQRKPLRFFAGDHAEMLMKGSLSIEALPGAVVGHETETVFAIRQPAEQIAPGIEGRAQTPAGTVSTAAIDCVSGVRSLVVEREHPVPQRLPFHAADLGCIRARHV